MFYYISVYYVLKHGMLLIIHVQYMVISLTTRVFFVSSQSTRLVIRIKANQKVSEGEVIIISNDHDPNHLKSHVSIKFLILTYCTCKQHIMLICPCNIDPTII